jgi:hypothetical protein
MKIGILTFHYSNNYGAILQTYALSTTLFRLGFDPVIINRIPDNRNSESFLSNIKFTISKKIHNHFKKSFLQFRKIYLQNITEQIVSDRELENIAQKFDAVIVGSDQVWRIEYTKDLGLNNFFDFVPDRIKKIAYAASFGLDEFDGNIEITEKVKILLSRFTSISVREDSGVTICKNIFNIDAIQLVDPTLLLNTIDYQQIIKTKAATTTKKFVAVYLLDSTNQKKDFVAKFAIKNGLKIHNISRKSATDFSIKRFDLNFKSYYYPSFSFWLQKIRDAEFVITDSFHGAAFSVLFNKEFICIANPSRGLTRMTSLLNTFNLKDRLISESDKLTSLQKIDFKLVNQILETERKKSIDFLTTTLNNIR